MPAAWLQQVLDRVKMSGVGEIQFGLRLPQCVGLVVLFRNSALSSSDVVAQFGLDAKIHYTKFCVQINSEADFQLKWKT